MDLEMEVLEPLEAPLENEFWTGFANGAAMALGAVAIVVAITT
jgi:hypothetical protein